MSKYQAYAITLRPKDGVTNEQIVTFNKWATRYSEYSLIVTEKEDTARHIHAGIFLKKPTLKGNICKLLDRLPLDLSATERIVFLQGVKPMFNHDWITYCNKGDFTTTIHSNLPEQKHLESYFAQSPTTSHVRKNLTYYGRLEKLWYEYNEPGVEINPKNVRDFLFRMMYSLRVIDVIRDDKSIIQVSRHLSRYINKAESSTIEPNPFELDL